MYKNQAGQIIYVFAYNKLTGTEVTGEAANITVYLAGDGGATGASTNSAVEEDATNDPGSYRLELTQGETNADIIKISGAHDTDTDVAVVGLPPVITTNDLLVTANPYIDGIWINTNASNTNTVPGIDGIKTNPVSTLAAAITLSGLTGNHKTFQIESGSSITLTGNSSNYVLIGKSRNWSLALGGQIVTDMYVYGCSAVTGTGIGATATLVDCIYSGQVTLNGSKTFNSGLDEMVITAGSFYVFDSCYNVRNNQTTIMNYGGGVFNTTIKMNDFRGAVQFSNMGESGTDILNLNNMSGPIVFTASCDSGTAYIYGDYNLTDLSDGKVTVIEETECQDIIDVIESQRGHHTGTGQRLYVGYYTGDTHANGARGGRNDPYNSVQDCHDNRVIDSNHDIITILADNPAGLTTIDERFTISKRYCFLRGPGRDLLIQPSTPGDVITITADGVEISGMRIESSGTGAGNCILISGADFAAVHHTYISGAQSDGIRMNGVQHSEIRDNSISHTGRNTVSAGIRIDAATGDSSLNRIERNQITKCTGAGIFITDSGGDNNIENTEVVENQCYSNTTYGINIDGSNVIETEVARNIFRFSGTADILDNGTDTTLENNEQWAKHSGVNVIELDGQLIITDGAGKISTTQELHTSSVDTVISQTQFTLSDGWGDGERLVGHLAVFYDADDSEHISGIRIVAPSESPNLNLAGEPHFTVVSGDAVRIFRDMPGVALTGSSAATTLTSLSEENEDLDTKLDEIKLKTDLIGLAPYTVVNPIDRTGEVRIFQGGDYLEADGRGLEFVFTGVEVDLDGQEMTMKITPTVDYESSDPATATVTTTATGSQVDTTLTVIFSITKAQSLILESTPAGGLFANTYQVTGEDAHTHETFGVIQRLTSTKRID